ncbi:3-oxo-tetronate kinase [Actinomadura sp. 6N118]|uniref:3-oxo-tetronate kinase n=1 Tax=Actinomadura sp. 6N118 TaxID=3375151 RepID=UPI0037AB334A
MTLGIIADDLTGATDAASAVRRTGLRVALTFGPPSPENALDVGADVVVAALKIRSLPVAEAVQAVRTTLTAFDEADVECVYYKYCSTFDSTPTGNIGPVADELLTALGKRVLLHVPGYPVNGRTVYNGHLFVDGVLLNESPMRHHPLNPMSDALLSRVLAPQTPHQIENLVFAFLHVGSAASETELRRLTAGDVPVHVLCDTLTNDHVSILADLATPERMAGGGAPMAAAVCAHRIGRHGTDSPSDDAAAGMPPSGHEIVIAGSASAATARQIAAFPGPVKRLSAAALADARTPGHVLAWAKQQQHDQPALPVLVSSDADQGGVTRGPAELNGRSAAEVVERGLGEIAARLVEAGARRVVVAGGETSGAVAGALGLSSVRVGAEICTGVPWTFTPTDDLAIAFKSGNFGPDDLFSRAFATLRSMRP